MHTKKSILIVDDDIAHRTMLRILLNWEYKVFEADDGQEAIEQVRRQPFDLVLMDVRMPKVNGLKALETIKASHPTLPVIMMTAYGASNTVLDALKKGAWGYFTKPFDFDELRDTIELATSNETREVERGNISSAQD
jgi:two-component system response regulator HydG